MTRQAINHGTTAGDGTGESMFSAFDKVNTNDTELFGAKTEFVANYAALPGTGQVGKIYVTLDTQMLYYWTGAAYITLNRVFSYANKAAFPAVGNSAGIYVANDTGVTWHWNGAAYQGIGRNANGDSMVNLNGGPDYPLVSAQYREAQVRARQASFGTLLTDMSNAVVVANGTPASGSAGVVTTDLPPIPLPNYTALRMIGSASVWSAKSQFAAAASTANFKGIAFWAKVKGRTLPTTTQVYLGNGADPYSGAGEKAIALTCSIPADGKWHLVWIPFRSWSAINGFVMGTDTIMSIGIRDRNDLNGLGMTSNAQEMQLGPVYLNPFSRPKFLIRFDDGLSDLLAPSATFTADGINQSWSCLSLCQQYGFGGKGSTFLLSRRFNTSNALKTFVTTAQLAQLAALGWSHCTQTHQDPFNNTNQGVMLMGPTGYTARAVTSVSTVTGNITASAAHNIGQGIYGGYPIVFNGTNLPAPLVIGTVYWARYVNATDYSLFATENDSIANINQIIPTTAGTPGNFTFRYGYSANDGSLIQQDLTNCINILTGMGYGNTALIWAPNQGAYDSVLCRAAAKAAGIKYILAIDNSGTGYVHPATRQMHMETIGAIGKDGVPADSFVTLQSTMQSDGVATASDIRNYVDAVIATGGVGSNYHHSLSTANGPQLAAYLDQLRLRVAEGACDVVTAGELMDYLDAAKTVTPGVVY